MRRLIPVLCLLVVGCSGPVYVGTNQLGRSNVSKPNSPGQLSLAILGLIGATLTGAKQVQ